MVKNCSYFCLAVAIMSCLLEPYFHNIHIRNKLPHKLNSVLLVKKLKIWLRNQEPRRHSLLVTIEEVAKSLHWVCLEGI